MISQTIDEVFDALPEEAPKTQLREIGQSWRKEAGSAKELFSRIRSLAQPSRASPWGKAWFRFEDGIRLHSTVLTPYELSRVFGLEAEFEESPYAARSSMTGRLRLDCDFPEPTEAERRAMEEKARLANMTPVQRQQYEQQLRQMKQQWMMPQQDAFVSAAQAEARVQKPRKMLDRQTLDHWRAVIRSRDVDLASKKALIVEANDVEEAVQFARLLSHERSCDLFRGQPKEWSPVPSILRLPEDPARPRWKRFQDWALAQKPLAALARDPKKLAAIGQHYGIPTFLLDFSKNPRVAAFFATHTDLPPDGEKACLYCLWSGALDASNRLASSLLRYYEIVPEVERVEVDGLYRMHAQEGSFVYANQKEWTSMFSLDVIRFPRRGPVTSPVPGDIYPVTKSEIEVLVADYFANEPEALKKSPS